MTTNEFYRLYNLKESNILELEFKNNQLTLLVEFPIYLEYIANGFRSDFDLNYQYQIIFKNVKGNYTSYPYLVNKYELLDNCLKLTINNTNYLIDNEVLIKRI